MALGTSRFCMAVSCNHFASLLRDSLISIENIKAAYKNSYGNFNVFYSFSMPYCLKKTRIEFLVHLTPGMNGCD